MIAKERPVQPSTAGEALPVLELTNLSMRWGDNTVLDGISLTLQEGERLAVVGPSGTGKSTVLRILAGLLLPSDGDLRINGVPQRYLRIDQPNPPDVRLVFQNPALLASLTVGENVGFLLYQHSGLKEQDIRIRVKRALEAVGLLGIEDLLPGELSGGMQKRVSFARALIEDPNRSTGLHPVLLFDEPTAGLDPVACTRIEDLIVTSSRLAGGCSVVVSHVMSTILRSAQRVAMLYDGRLQWCGPIDDFTTTANAYVTQFRSGSLQGPMQPAEL